MDPLTHVLSGALAARASYTAPPSSAHLSLRDRTLVGGLAAIAPDVDYVIYFYDTLAYLNWHRGITHSLVLMPLVALLLSWLVAGIFSRIRRRPYRWRDLYGVCLLGVGVHILGDSLTPYGTMLFAPLSDTKYSLSTTFVVDPWFTAIILLGLALSVKWPLGGARLGMIVLGCYLGLQVMLYHQARDLAREYALRSGLSGFRVHVLPQPLSPFNWKLMTVDGESYHSALAHLGSGQTFFASVNQGGILQRLAAAYRPADDLAWRVRNRFGSDLYTQVPARDAWHRESMAGVRRFSLFPAAFNRSGEGGESCIWFTDLRFELPVLDPPFQFKVCRSPGASEWGRVEAERLLRIRHPRREI